MAIANRTPKHVRPRRNLRQVMKGVALLAASIAVAAAVTVPIGLAQGTVMPADRTAVNSTMTAQLTAHTTAKPANWTARTCNAEHAYVSRRGSLAVMISDAAHLGRSYLKSRHAPARRGRLEPEREVREVRQR